MDYYKEHERELTEFVDREVIYCVSSLIYDLGMGEANNPHQNIDILEKFPNLYQGAPSWGTWTCPECFNTWEGEPDEEDCKRVEYLEDQDCKAELDSEDYKQFEPIDYTEIYEHWIVTGWLADKLEEQGEAIERDFYGLVVWSRTTTGQSISLDGVSVDIHRKIYEEVKK